MDQNQPVDDDLQKAIEKITNTTNVDPVFADPIAAPAAVSENKVTEPNESSNSLLEESDIQMVSSASNPTTPLQSTNTSKLTTPPLIPGPETFPPITPPASEPMLDIPSVPNQNPTPNEKMSTKEVKIAALRDLAPLLNRIEIDPLQKFNIYRNMFEHLRDYAILDSAYKTAREISDETKRAEALLFLIESIDKM